LLCLTAILTNSNTFVSYDQICAHRNTCSAFARTDHSLSSLLRVHSGDLFEGEQQIQDGNVSRMAQVLAHLVATTSGQKGTVLHTNRQESNRTPVQMKLVIVKAEPSAGTMDPTSISSKRESN
jgi:uncharacterized protein YukE